MNTRLTLIAAALMMTAAAAAQAGTAAGTQITNQATATYLDAALGSHNATSNTVTTTVQQVAAVTVNTGANKNAAAGTQVVYAQTVTNTGNGSDTFTLSATNAGQFAMTNVVFYADANGDGVADNATPITSTGALAAGGTFKYVAVGIIPGTASVGNTNNMVVTATSTFTGTVNSSSTNVTTISVGAAADLTANQTGSGAPGFGPGVETSAVVTNTTTAGTMTRFKLYVTNSGGTADTFNLAGSADAAFGSGLPSGWTVVFKDSSNAVITATTVNAGASNQIWAEVTPPAGTAAGTTDVYFRAQSPVTGISDRIHTAVTIAAGNVLVTLAKTQALDANCDGVADTPFSNAAITTGAVPGACIRYSITATNTGAAVVNSVVISDVIPANTTYHATVPASATAGLVAAPWAGMTGTVAANIGTLTVGEAETLTFGVKINP